MKQALIERAIAENDIEDRDAVIMIGDRLYDIEGAKEAGVDSIGETLRHRILCSKGQ